MKTQRLAVAFGLALLLSACASQIDQAVSEAPSTPGFLWGLWHGFIFPWSWIGSLFSPDIAVYAVPEGRHRVPSSRYPILMSYLDVVVQGYLREFGECGALNFFATTKGWDSPILNDRESPRYPRYQQLSRRETAFVDDQLAGIGVSVISADQIP